MNFPLVIDFSDLTVLDCSLRYCSLRLYYSLVRELRGSYFSALEIIILFKKLKKASDNQPGCWVLLGGSSVSVDRRLVCWPLAQCTCCPSPSPAAAVPGGHSNGSPLQSVAGQLPATLPQFCHWCFRILMVTTLRDGRYYSFCTLLIH